MTEQGDVACDGSGTCPAETHILGCFRSKAEPVAEQGDVEATKRALEDPRTKAELLAALERAERERDHYRFHFDQQEQRAEKAEAEVELVRSAFNDQVSRLKARADKAELALAENAQTWEDMRAYNIRLEERAREAERALADIADGSWGRKAQQVNYDVQEFARAALRPSEDTSDES